MANYYTHLSFALEAPPEKLQSLKYLIDIIDKESWEEDSDIPLMFQNPDMPYLGATLDFNKDLTVCSVADEGGTPDLEAIAKVIQSCGIYNFGFTWAETCDKPRYDAFGGGWCAVFKDRIEWGSARTDLEAALREKV